MPVVKIEVDPNKQFQAKLREAIAEVKNIRVPLTLIAKDWFKSNRAIFTLSGPGKYVDLTEKYKEQKLKAVGFIYPILKRSGLLEASITDPADANSINLIVNNNTLILGTKVSYAQYHQFGTKHLPIRPIVFVNGEQSAPDELFNRSKAWEKILESYVLQKSAKLGKTKSNG